MIERYLNRRILLNDKEMYEDVFFERSVKHINQYETPKFEFPNKDNISKISLQQHIWKTGDKYYKLASKYYGDPKDWWVIAKFNNKPTESHLKIGDIILIPTPLQQVLNIMKG
jgi:nucleoid-associated protein YgaU